MNHQTKTQHSAFQSLPIVDISLLYSDQLSDRQQVAKELDKAARDAGFLYLKGHNISKDLIDALKAVAKSFFAQDLDNKMQSYIGLSQNHSGYVPQGEEAFYSGQMDLKEGYDIGFESSSLMKQFYPGATNQWPSHEGFRETASAYYQAVFNLSKLLFSGFALALGLPEDAFESKLKEPPSQLRVLHYFDNPNATDADSGIGAHTDYEFFTILLPTAPGLQVLNGAGEWIDVPVLEGCFVINIGDMMEVITNGHYVATSHRVRKVKEERYAFPFFSSLDYDTVVEPLPSLCSKDSPPQYEAIVCGDHLFAQTTQTFQYLKDRLAKGEIWMPEASRSLASFGHEKLKEG